MVHKFDFQEIDLKGAYLIKPFLLMTTEAGSLRIIMSIPIRQTALTMN